MARPTRTMLIAGAAVVVAAAIGGGVTYLATSPTAQDTAAQAAPVDGHGKAGKVKVKKAERAGGGGGGMLGKVEHGEFTTASAGVMQVQRGAITAIDTGSLTVRSSDGFTASYTITPTTAVGKAGKGRNAAAQAPGAAVPGAVPAPGAAGSGAPGAGAAGAAGVSQLQPGDTVQVMAAKTDTGSTATRIAPSKA